MIKQIRPKQPRWLAEHSEKWGKQYQARKEKDSKAVFYWPTYNGQKINTLLAPILAEQMTQYHCSFCDAYPMGYTIPITLEHFKPKSKFPTLVCNWHNLYVCCGHCQEKNSNYSELLLRPDAEDYSFERYFIYNYASHLLEVNPTALLEDQKRAAYTIQAYKLNTPKRQAARELELTAFEQSNNNEIDDFSYRFLYT